MLMLASFCTAQEKIRTIEHGKYRLYDIKSEPIAIVSRELGDKPFMTNRQVLGGPDWLRDLTLGVKNISNKTIKNFEIHIIIDKQGNMATGVTLLFRFPPPPEPVLSQDGKPTGAYQPVEVLKPGEVVKVKAPDSQLRMLDFIKKEGVVDIDRVSLSIQKVDFDDGTRWYQGVESREDPNYVPVIPDRPGLSLSQLFSKSLSSFALVDGTSQPLVQFAFIFPAKSRFFGPVHILNSTLPCQPSMVVDG